MSDEQSQMFPVEQTSWREYRRDPVPHVRHLPVEQQIKHCAARYVWKHRDELCPKNHVHEDGTVGPISWATWFAIYYHTTIDEFQRQHQKGK